MLPYWCIADGTRFVRKPRTYGGLGAFFRRNAECYRRALWDTQDVYVECWVEKDAISGILYQVTEPWDVPLYVCRGYPSETFVYNAAETLKAADKPAFIYYFGDLDPSGWNISKSLEVKLRDFGAEFNFERVVVQPWQVEAWGLPTRPVKANDTRAKGWRWPCVEVDAIPANRLRELCEAAIMRHADAQAVADLRRTEALERETLETIAANWQRKA